MQMMTLGWKDYMAVEMARDRRSLTISYWVYVFQSLLLIERDLNHSVGGRNHLRINPRDRPMLYQTFLSISTWSWGIYQLVFMRLCNYYLGADHPGIYQCQGKDFLATF